MVPDSSNGRTGCPQGPTLLACRRAPGSVSAHAGTRGALTGRSPSALSAASRPSFRRTGQSGPVGEGGGVVIVPPAELDYGTSVGFEREVLEAYRAGASLVEVDFAAVTFCDSSGLRAMIHAAKYAQAAGRGFAITHPTVRLMRLAEMLGASGVLGLPPPPPR